MKDFTNITIGIAGCGGLGSNAANNLVRLGFKNFILADFDKVEKSNLNRQFYFNDQIGEYKCDALKNNLERINPFVNIKTVNKTLSENNIEEVFNVCNFIVEGFDSVECKKMLIEKLSCNKKIAAASGLSNYWDVDNIKTKYINENLVIIGDFKTETHLGKSASCPGVQIIAAKQASSILEFTKGLNQC